jgi:uncharacterized protein
MSDRISTMIPHKLQKLDMTTEATNVDFAFFTPAVKRMLPRPDSPEHCSRTEHGSIKTHLGPREGAFIAGQDSFYVAAIGEDRWPYTQRHRGPNGFLRVLDATTLGFASVAGTRRYISPGNALVFLIDHTLQDRLKIWTDAQVSEDPAIIKSLAESRGCIPTMHLAFLFHVRAFGWNYEKHTVQHVQRSVREVHITQSVRPAKSDRLLIKKVEAKRCLSLDASNGGWMLNSHSVGVQV